jgi:hypothetical protein
MLKTASVRKKHIRAGQSVLSSEEVKNILWEQPFAEIAVKPV